MGIIDELGTLAFVRPSCLVEVLIHGDHPRTAPLANHLHIDDRRVCQNAVPLDLFAQVDPPGQDVEKPHANRGQNQNRDLSDHARLLQG